MNEKFCYIVRDSWNGMVGVYTCISKAQKACDKICGGFVEKMKMNAEDALAVRVYDSNWQ